MSRMGKVEINIPLVTWRAGRPRFFAGPAARELGFKGQDLRHADGRWFSLEECIAWSKARQDEIAARRRDVAAGATTPRRLRTAAQQAARVGQVTVGQVIEDFRRSPRATGREIVEGRKKRPALAANTVRYYANAAAVLERFDAGAVWVAPAAELTGRALSGILHKIEVGHGLATARSVRALVSVAFRHGRRARLVAHDPVAALEESLPVPDARVRPASVAEIEHLVAVADALGLADAGDLVTAGVWTAQRQNDRIAVRAHALSADGILWEPSKKRRSAERLLVPVAAALAQRLEAGRRRRRAWKVQPLALFPCERTGRPWEADWWRKVFRAVRHAAATGQAEPGAETVLRGLDVPQLLAAAGLAPMPSLADLRDQDLRDTALSWAALAGCDKWEMAALSGHAFGKEDKVLRHYVSVPPEFARRAIAKMEAWHAAQLGALAKAAR